MPHDDSHDSSSDPAWMRRWQRSEEAEDWSQLTELRQRLFGGATARMLEAAQLKPGDRVLDIAAGTGDQGRDAARLVGPGGAVLSTDISPAMLAVATRLAQQEGLGNVTTRVMNAEWLDLPESSYDAVISRFGLMLIAQRDQALAEIWRILKPDGRLAALVWSAPERNPLFRPYIAVVASYRKAAHPDEHAPDPFALADSALFAAALQRAGFREARVEAVDLTMRFASFDELRRWWGAPFEEAVASGGPQESQRLLDDMRQRVRQFEGPEGIIAPAALLLGVGMK